MKPNDAVRKKLVAEWRRKAEGDFQLAEHLVEDELQFPEAIMFHCQQAAEKYRKAFLTSQAVHFPKTHDLEELLKLAATVNPSLARGLHDVIVLTPYGVELRYPGDRSDPSRDEVFEAVELARRVRHAVSPLLSDSSRLCSD